MKIFLKTFFVFLTIYVSICILIIYMAISNIQLVINKTDQAIEIQTLWMGEYYSPVEELVITEATSGDIVVILKQKKHKAGRMHTVTINEGINNFDDMYLDKYLVLYPDNSLHSFKKGVKYHVRVRWTDDRVMETSFVL